MFSLATSPGAARRSLPAIELERSASPRRSGWRFWRWRTPSRDALGYIIGPLAGAVLAAFVLWLIAGRLDAAATGYGALHTDMDMRTGVRQWLRGMRRERVGAER